MRKSFPTRRFQFLAPTLHPFRRPVSHRGGLHPCSFLPTLRNFHSADPTLPIDRKQHHISHASPEHKQSSITFGSLSIVAAGILTTILGTYIWSQYSHAEDQGLESDSHLTAGGRPLHFAGMTVKYDREGWPGNLTPEHEAKLKEMWKALLKMQGRIDDKSGVDIVAMANGEQSPESKKKKRRFGLFGSRDGNDETTNNADEDKHGQVKEFKQALKDMSIEELHQQTWDFAKADDPDAMLLRFLRARKWDVQNALIMMISTGRWRAKEIHLDDELMRNGEEYYANLAKNGTGDEKKLGEDFMAQLRLGKSIVHGIDKKGRPMVFVRVKLHHGGDQSQESMEKYTVYTIESVRMLLKPPVDTANIIFDMTDFSMANMDYTPVKFMIKVFEANYPESLGHVCVHKSPWIFHSIWTIIKGWLDPVVAAKVHFTKDAADLEEFVPHDNILTEHGGADAFKYEYIEPKEGENALQKDDAARKKIQEERAAIVEEYEKATVQWCKNEGGSEVVKRREELADQLNQNYWKLDPYVRAKSIYDRQGLIGDGGKVDMYPERSGASLTNGADDVD